MVKKYTDQGFRGLKAMPEIMEWILGEHLRQLTKWGIQTRTAFEWMTYLTEEVGELAKAISEVEYREGERAQIKKEAIQVATLALKIAEMMGG